MSGQSSHLLAFLASQYPPAYLKGPSSPSLSNHLGFHPFSCNFLDWNTRTTMNHVGWNLKKHAKRRARRTILCLCSNRSFSALALSYSPFSRCRWSGRSLESVGGRISLIHDQISNIRQSYTSQLEIIKEGYMVRDWFQPWAPVSAHSKWSKMKSSCIESDHAAVHCFSITKYHHHNSLNLHSRDHLHNTCYRPTSRTTWQLFSQKHVQHIHEPIQM